MKNTCNHRTPRWLSLISQLADTWGNGTRNPRSDSVDRGIMTVITGTLAKGIPLSPRQKEALLASIKTRLGKHIEWEGEVQLTHEQLRQAKRTGKFEEIYSKVSASVDVKSPDVACESDVKVEPNAPEGDVKVAADDDFTSVSQPFHSDLTSLSQSFHTLFTPFSQKRSNSVMPDSDLGSSTIRYDTERNVTDGRVSPPLNPSVLEVLPSPRGSWSYNGAGSLAGRQLRQNPANPSMIPPGLQMRLHAQQTGQALDEVMPAEMEGKPEPINMQPQRDLTDVSWMSPQDIVRAAQSGHLNEEQATQALARFREALMQIPEITTLTQSMAVAWNGPVPQGIVGSNPSIEISVWAGEREVIGRVDWSLSKYNVRFTRWDIVEEQLCKKDYEHDSNRTFRLERYSQLGKSLRADEAAHAPHRWNNSVKHAVSGLHDEHDRERRGGLARARVLLFMTWKGGNPYDITIWNGEDIHVVELHANTRMRSADAPNFKGKLKN